MSPIGYILLLSLLYIYNTTPVLSQGFYLGTGAQVYINSGTDLYVGGNMTIEDGASLTRNGTGRIRLTGDLIVNGTGAFVPGSGILEFIGNVNSIIGGTAVNPIDLFDVEINKADAANIVQLQAATDIANDLDVILGHFTFSGAVPFALSVGNNLSITGNGVFEVQNSGSLVYDFLIGGNISNNGVFNLNNSPNSVVNTEFTGPDNSIVSGVTPNFNFIEVNKADRAYEVRISSAGLNAPGQFLTLTRGLFRISGNFAFTNTFFPIAAGQYEINSESGLWIENPNVTVTGQNASLLLGGYLRTRGTYNIGTGSSTRSLTYDDGATMIIDNGAMNIDSRLSRNNDDDKIFYAQYDGNVTLGIGSNSSVDDRGMFDIGEESSTFTWNDGNIEIRRQSNAASRIGDYLVLADSGAVTGGKLIVNDQNPIGQQYQINTVQPVAEFEMIARDNVSVRLVGDATTNFTVLGNITLAGSVNNSFNCQDASSNSHDIFVGGDWINNFGNPTFFNAALGTVTFNGATDQRIRGSQSTVFNNFSINQTVAGRKVFLNRETTANGNVRIMSSTKLDLYGYDLNVGAGGELYSDNATTQTFDDRFILNSGGASGTTWAELRRYLTNSGSLPAPLMLLFPVGTPGPSGEVYTRAMIELQDGTALSNAWLSIKCIPTEHPNVESPNRSLTKFWNLAHSGITLGATGVNLEFYYDQSEEVGSIGNYHVLEYRLSNWYVDPGNNLTNVNIGLRRIRAVQVTSNFDGDWTAGELDAARSKYYSRNNGNYNDPLTWSKESHVGVVSTVAPHLSADEVYVGNYNIVTLTANPPAAKKIIIENTGTLLTQTFTVPATVDTFRVETGGALGIGNSSGITAAGATGNIQAVNRMFGTGGTYIYNGNTSPQSTGNGLPSRVSRLVVNKNAFANTVNLSQSVTIGDSLEVYQGTLYVDKDYAIDGEDPGSRQFSMYGGRVTFEGGFPNGYSAPWFYAGEIDFNGADALIIPSGGSVPAVKQYNNLTIRGNRGYSFITFQPEDTIRIYGTFDISQQNFIAFTTPRFITSGTTFMFNGTGNQNIPMRSAVSQWWAYLNYYNLIIGGSGTKTTGDAGDYTIYNNVYLDNATFALNSTAAYNLAVQGNWINNGGLFQHNTRTVTFTNNAAADTNVIDSKNQPFNNVVFAGVGKYYYVGNMSVASQITINANSYFGGFDASSSTFSDTLSVAGNWTDNGTFEPGNSLVRFNGSADQTISKNASERFCRLMTDKSAGNVIIQNAAGRNIVVDSLIIFNKGNIYARDNTRFVAVRGNIIRPGTGHVDGPVRMWFPDGNTQSKLCAVGTDANYRPATIQFSGVNGNPGFVNVTNSTTDNAFFTSNGNSFLIWNRAVNRRWDLTVPSDAGYNTFDIGYRTYDLTVGYENADINNYGTTSPMQFVTRRLTGTTWYKSDVGTRTLNTTQSLGHEALGAIIVGEPSVRVFYSIADGNWSNPTTWSTAGYTGAATTVVPDPDDSVKIGNGKTVTLDQNVTINAAKAIIIEKALPTNRGGFLNCGQYIISGAGNFILKTGGGLGVGHAQGIRTDGSDGNVRTTTAPSFNEGGHNNGNFTYNGVADQVTGTGLPATVATLTMNNPGRIVSLLNNIVITDSLNFIAGTFDVATNNRDISLWGNWRNSATFTEGTRTVTLNGTGNQRIFNTDKETFYNLTINKSSGNVILSGNDIEVDGVLNFPATNNAALDSRTNSKSVIVDGSVTRVRGHVNGEMQKYFSTGDIAAVTFEIGTSSGYTPVEVNVGAPGSDPGTGGYVGFISYPTDHPQIALSTFNLDKNVQRYWTARPKTGFGLGDRPYEIKLTFVYPDDIRNGADYTDFVIRRYSTSTTWTDGDLTDQPAGAYFAHASGIRTLGEDYALGEESPQGKKYYSIASGAWNNPANWSPDGFSGVSDGTYPSQSSLVDIAIIGNNQAITLDQDRLLSAVTVLDTLGGMGHLIFNDKILTGDQFELKRGGKISIGSAAGITTAGATGNVRTTIRNYDQGSSGRCHFRYTGAAVVTGDGLPAQAASLEIDITPASTIVLTNAIDLYGNLTLTNGTFNCNNNNISLSGNWVNNATYTSGSETVSFKGDTNQYCSGASVTTFNNLSLTKTAGNLILNQSIQVNGSLNFVNPALILPLTNSLTIGQNGTIDPAASLGSTRMIQFNGTGSAGKLIKLHTNGNGVTRSFTFPVGIGSDYNPAVLSARANYNSARTEVRVVTGPHPNRQPSMNNMLKKYWNVNTVGITNLTALQPDTRYEFYFVPTDITGNRLKYIPGLYNSASGWEVNVGTAYTIDLTKLQVNNMYSLNGDWTMGEPGTFFKGRIYYSRANGNWSDAVNWSNISHAGAQSIVPPGYFEMDTVYVGNGNTITYNVSDSAVSIGLLGIAQSGNGTLNFVRATNKHLKVKGNLLVNNGGSIGQSGAGNRYDTLTVWGNIANSASGGNSIDLNFGAATNTKLIMAGSGNSTITGTGNWDLRNFEVNKTGGLNNKVINQSTSFTTSLSNSVQANTGQFMLTSGLFRHEVNQTLWVDYSDEGNDNVSGTNDPIFDTWDFYTGANSGFEIPTGEIRVGDDMVTSNNDLIDISGGTLRIGTGNNENFLYETGTRLKISSGQMIVAACFSNRTTGSAINLEISGGTITVVNSGSTQYGDIYGFGLKSSSTMTWSDGTIIYAHPTNGGYDYVVQASTYSITGGTLQFGIVGNFLNAGQSHSMSSLTPIWNLVVEESRYATFPDRHCALTLLDAENTVLNNVLINTNGTLDLNGKNMYIGGNFTNRGRFTPDGRGWDTDGERQVTFNGTGNQVVYNLNAYANSQSGNSMNNEPFFDFYVRKTSGTVQLSNDNSILYVRNKLEFKQGNTAVIDARTNSQRTEIWTRGGAGDLGQVNRFPSALGHVNGALRMEVSNAGSQNVLFHVGAGNDYTPALLEFGAGTGTAGKLQCITFGNDPANIAQNGVNIDLNRNIQRYWTFSVHDGFALGTRRHDLTLTFLDPQDKRSGNVNWTVLNQFWTADPANMTPPPYTVLLPGERTITTNQSLNNTLLAGSYMVAELTSLKFYSRQSGLWNDGNTWSYAGYGGVAAGAYPEYNFHEAYISNGDKVTVPDAFQPDIKAINVEAYSGTYGHLDIEPNTYVKSIAFSLANSCTMTVEGPDGIVSITDPNPNQGAVQSSSVRSFGISHYIFNNSTTVQSIGTGLPGDIMSLTIDNRQGGSFNLVAINTENELNVRNFIHVKNGQFDAGPGNNAIKIKGNLIFDKDTIRSNHRLFQFDGTGTQYIYLNNNKGIVFDQLYLAKTGAIGTAERLEVGGSSLTGSLSIESLLRFVDGNKAYIKLLDTHKIKLRKTTTLLERRGNLAFGHVDGVLQKYIQTVAGEAVTFELGTGTDYAPITMVFPAAGGVTGAVDAVNLTPVPKEPFYGNRMDTTVQVPRYWRITIPTESAFQLGGRKFDISFRFPRVDYLRLTPPYPPQNAVIRRRSIPAESYLWTERKFDELDWLNPLTTDTAEVSLASALPTSDYWPGFGEFFIGEKSKRIFYSRNGGGNWNDNNSWSFYQSGSPVANEYPNPDWSNPPAYKFETRDSVIIDDNDVINLNTLPEVAYLNIAGNLGAGTGGRLVIPDGGYVMKSSKSGSISVLNVGENGNVEIRNLNMGIGSTMPTSVFRFDAADQYYDNYSNFTFSGAGAQTFGDAFPDTVQHITIGNTASDIVEMASETNKLNVLGNLTINQGDLRPKNNMTSLYMKGNLVVNGTFNGATASNGTDPYALECVFYGDNASSQTFSGSGTAEFYTLSMDRQGAGSGVLEFNKSAHVLNIVDMRKDAGNTGQQIIALGSAADLVIDNQNINSIVNYNGIAAPYRYIRTSTASGYLIRTIQSTGGTYTYPVGSYDSFGGNPADDHYTPAVFTGDNSGAVQGTIGVRVSQGQGAASIDRGHMRLSQTLTTDYLARYWAINYVTTTVPGKWRFNFLDGDKIGDQDNINTIARWQPPAEGPPGYWQPYLPPGVAFDMTSNYFEMTASQQAGEFTGDWTMANEEAFLRIFYSRQTGNWNDDQSWTFSPTHSGAIAGAGLYPMTVLDSVVIGGGNPGASVPNHEITLNLASSTVRGVAVGTSNTNTGTLLCQDNVVQGKNFTLYNLSTLGVGSPNGIVTVATGNSGNIRTSLTRNFSYNGNGSFIYNGTADQAVGDALPATVMNFTVDNTGAALTNNVNLDKNIDVLGNLLVNNGRFDVSTYSVNGNGGNFSITNGGIFAVGGSNNLQTSAEGFNDYTGIQQFGYVEFYGNNQYMDVLPAAMHPVTVGYGSLLVTDAGTKYIQNTSGPLYLRGELVVRNGAKFRNEHNASDNPVRILWGVLNSAEIENDGVLDIGQ